MSLTAEEGIHLETGAPQIVGAHEVEARVCSYGVQPDTYGTRWCRGVFADSLADMRAGRVAIPMVWAHDEKSIANLIGSVISGEDKPTGLYLRMRFANFDEVPSARAAYSLMRDGHIRAWSFKFRDATSTPDPQYRGALLINRAKLIHVSPVVDASVPGTATTEVRDSMLVGVRSAARASRVDRALAILEHLREENQPTRRW